MIKRPLIPALDPRWPQPSLGTAILEVNKKGHQDGASMLLSEWVEAGETKSQLLKSGDYTSVRLFFAFFRVNERY